MSDSAPQEDTSKTATSVICSAAPVAGLYQLNAQLIEKSIVDLKDEHVHLRPNEHTNSIHWIIGHVTDTRYELAQLLGASGEHSFGKLFSMGAEHKSPADYPSLSELMKSFREITKIIESRFADISEEAFHAEAENAFPNQDKTVSGCLTFLSFHEAYHTGQIAMVRKFFGYDQLVG